MPPADSAKMTLALFLKSDWSWAQVVHNGPVPLCSVGLWRHGFVQISRQLFPEFMVGLTGMRCAWTLVLESSCHSASQVVPKSWFTSFSFLPVLSLYSCTYFSYPNIHVSILYLLHAFLLSFFLLPSTSLSKASAFLSRLILQYRKTQISPHQHVPAPLKYS